MVGRHQFISLETVASDADTVKDRHDLSQDLVWFVTQSVSLLGFFAGHQCYIILVEPGVEYGSFLIGCSENYASFAAWVECRK